MFNFDDFDLLVEYHLNNNGNPTINNLNMDSFRNICENHNLIFKYFCSEDQEPLCDKCIELQTIHRSHEVKMIKDQRQTNFGSKGESTQQTKLKERSEQLKASIKSINTMLKPVHQLAEFLKERKSKMERELSTIENQLDELNKYLLDSRCSSQSFDSFCEKKPNKYNTTANFGAIKPSKINLDIRIDQDLKVLVDNVCRELGFSSYSDRRMKVQKLGSPSRGLIFSPKGNNANLQTATKPSHHLSPKIHTANMTYTSSSPKFMTTGYSGFTTNKIRTSPQPGTILDKLKKQKAQFNEFKNRFNY